MKNIFAAILILTTSSFARAAKLECKQSTYVGFYADLDSSHMSEGNFEVKNARLRYEFVSADDLRCVGSELKDIKCVGYWLNLTHQAVVEVQVKEFEGKVIASIHTLRNDESGHPGFMDDTQIDCQVRK